MTVMQSVNVLRPDDVIRAENEAGTEFVAGQIVEKPVSNVSSSVGRRVAQLLGVEADKTGSACVYDSSMGYQCFPEDPAKFRKPDASAVRTERLQDLPRVFGLMPIPADLAVEVNSPNDFASNVLEKVEEYLGAGFGIVWVVDPPTKSVTIHRADGTVAWLHEDHEITGESAVPSFKCKVGEFFNVPGKR